MNIVGTPCGRPLWVVRHGESTWNAAGRMQREVAHPPLTARGTTQAYAAGYALRGNHIDRIVTSDAVRALQTATAISTVLDSEVLVDSRFRERGWAANIGPVDADSAGPQRLEDPEPRIKAALRELAKLDGVSVLVTHGDIVCTILDILGSRDTTTSRWETGGDVPNGVVVEVDLRWLDATRSARHRH
jgi:broad specificity phosphatase PhoE